MIGMIAILLSLISTSLLALFLLKRDRSRDVAQRTHAQKASHMNVPVTEILPAFFHFLGREDSAAPELSLYGDRDSVVGRIDLSLGKELRLLHPALCPLEHFPRIGFEHQPFPGSETANVDHAVIFCR